MCGVTFVLCTHTCVFECVYLYVYVYVCGMVYVVYVCLYLYTFTRVCLYVYICLLCTYVCHCLRRPSLRFFIFIFFFCEPKNLSSYRLVKT